MGSLASAGTTPVGKTRVRVLPALRPRAPPRPAVHEASSTGFDAPAALGLATTRRPGVAFVGEGARRFGGRWNPVGVPVVYAATTLSLAALEVLAHVDPEEARRYWVYRIVVPDDAAERLVPADAPRGWNAARPRPATARVEVGGVAPLARAPRAVCTRTQRRGDERVAESAPPAVRGPRDRGARALCVRSAALCEPLAAHRGNFGAEPAYPTRRETQPGGASASTPLPRNWRTHEDEWGQARS